MFSGPVSVNSSHFRQKYIKKSRIEKSETLSFGVMVSYAYHTHTARVAGSEVGGEEPRRLGVVTAWREVE